jgi:hypothetical protein
MESKAREKHTLSSSDFVVVVLCFCSRSAYLQTTCSCSSNRQNEGPARPLQVECFLFPLLSNICIVKEEGQRPAQTHHSEATAETHIPLELEGKSKPGMVEQVQGTP